MAAKAGRLQIQLDMQIAQLQRDLDKANRMIADSAGNWQKSFTSVFTGTLATDFFNKLSGAISQTITDLGDIADKSAALGDSAEMFQRLSYAADQSGVSMDAVVTASGKLQKQLGQIAQGEGKDAADALTRLGLSADDLRKLSTGEALVKVAGTLGTVADNAEKAATGAALLGKGWQTLMPLAAQGEAALTAMMKQANVASDEAVKAADEFGDSVAAMQGTTKTFIAEALAPLLPLLTKSAQEFVKVGGAAAGAADGVDRATSSARQLGETAASILHGLEGFRDVLNELQSASVQSFKGWQWPWEDDAPQKTNDLANAWSRMTNNFAGVKAAVSTTGEFFDAAKMAADAAAAAADAADKAEAAAKKEADAKAAAAKATAAKAKADAAAERALAKHNAEVEKAVRLNEQMFDAIMRNAGDVANRETDLINQRTLAIARYNGATAEELEIQRMRLEGATDTEIALAQQVQAWDMATEASATRQRELAENAAMYSDTLVSGFDDIFTSMTEGSAEAEDAVKRLIVQLIALWTTQQAMQALGFNSPTSWGFQGVAKGAAFDQRGMMPFALGGIVRSATPFTFGGGRAGVMGEAGPEAILPLGRDSAGRLGVRGGGVTVNVHNNNASQIGVEQRGQDINVIVDQVRGVIANDFARGGNIVTTAFEGAYGARR